MSATIKSVAALLLRIPGGVSKGMDPQRIYVEPQERVGEASGTHRSTLADDMHTKAAQEEFSQGAVRDRFILIVSHISLPWFALR